MKLKSKLKKILAGALMAVMIWGLAACSGQEAAASLTRTETYSS